MTILFRVRVPVLSEQSMFMPAISSMAVRRVTMAPCADSWRDPRANVVVLYSHNPALARHKATVTTVMHLWRSPLLGNMWGVSTHS